MPSNSPIILASSSEWRLKLLRSAGLCASAVSPSVDEGAIQGSTPEETAQMRAEAKAREVAERYPGHLVIGADQVAHLDGRAFGKPPDEETWRGRLRAMSGRTHSLSSGVAVVEGGQADVFVVTTHVTFRDDVTDEEIDAYIRYGEARGCAGGYMAEQVGAWFVASVEGDWNNVIGLPMFAILDRLRRRGRRLDDVLGDGREPRR